MASISTLDNNHKAMAAQPLRILLVEDDLGDARLTQEMIHDTGFPVIIDLVRDGDEAIHALTEAISDESAPALVLLDLNLPKRSGHEVLEFIRGNEDIADTCVIIFTGSTSPEDMQRARENKVNGYLMKPTNADQMEEMTRKFRDLLSSPNAASCLLLQLQVI